MIRSTEFNKAKERHKNTINEISSCIALTSDVAAALEEMCADSREVDEISDTIKEYLRLEHALKERIRIMTEVADKYAVDQTTNVKEMFEDVRA